MKKRQQQLLDISFPSTKKKITIKYLHNHYIFSEQHFVEVISKEREKNMPKRIQLHNTRLRDRKITWTSSIFYLHFMLIFCSYVRFLSYHFFVFL